MDAATWWQLAVAVVLVPLAGVFAAADAALGSVSRARVEALVRAGRPGSRQLSAVVADRPRYVNLLLLLRLACETTAIVLLTVVSLTLVRPVGLATLVAAVAMVVVSYVLIGVGPRTVGRQHPYGIGLWLAAPVRALARLLGPLTRLLIVVGNAITPGRGFREGPFSSEVELRELVDLARQRGVVAEDERAMIHSVFELGDTPAREVMVPRTDVVWIERTKSVRQALTLALRSGYSRMPVVGENVDDVVGLAYLKDLVPADQQAPVTAAMRPASFVPDSKRIDELLREMQRSHNHMAVVVDEYGGTAGLVTIEDIVEEIVGEITDEYDPHEHPPIERLQGSLLRVAGRLPVPDLEAATGAELEHADVDTVAGLLAQRLGRVPLPGAEAEIAGLRLRAEGSKDARGRMRITTVLVWRAGGAGPDGPDEPASNDHREGSEVRA